MKEHKFKREAKASLVCNKETDCPYANDIKQIKIMMKMIMVMVGYLVPFVTAIVLI